MVGFHEWASTVRYLDTDDPHRKTPEVVCVDKPEECEVKIADANEGKSLEVINYRVLLP